MRNPLLLCRVRRDVMDHPFWHIATSAHDESFTNLPSGGFLSLYVFPPFKLVFWLRVVSSPQLAAASALSPVMWGPFSVGTSLLSPFFQYNNDRGRPISVLMCGTAAGFSHHTSAACAPPGLLRGAGISVYSYIKHDE